MSENTMRLSSSTNVQDGLQDLILDSFEAALDATDHHVAFRLLKSLERHLLKPGISLEQRTRAVGLLVGAHRRLLEHQLSCTTGALFTTAAGDPPVTRH